MSDHQNTYQEPRTGAGAVLRHVPAAILVIVLVAFALDNRRKVKVGFVFTDERVPLIFVLLATAVIGALVAALLRRRRR